MRSYKKVLVISYLMISLTTWQLSALAATVDKNPDKNRNTPEYMTVDIIAARPLGLVATIGGAVVFLVSLPFSAAGGNTAEAWDSLVVTPAEYTFQRPLGNFDE